MNKANQLLEQIHEEGIRQSLAEEVENLKAATNKADADLDEVNSQVKDVLTRIASALQQEKENAEQDPQTLVLYQKLYDILMSLHSYLESNNGSDADFDKVDALLDQLSAKSKDKTALLESTKAILVLNHQIQSKEKLAQVKKQVQQEMLKQMVITPVLRTNQTQLQNLTLKLLATKTNQAIQEILNLLNQLQKIKQQNLLQLLEIKKNQ
ncbi:Pneumococcal histidine triad protein D precursor [Streptococcus pneumoniae]|nr:Pneumococcal histidine triad protein D precursor [Streptococcus pneumoniae]